MSTVIVVIYVGDLLYTQFLLILVNIQELYFKSIEPLYFTILPLFCYALDPDLRAPFDKVCDIFGLCKLSIFMFSFSLASNKFVTLYCEI